MNCARELLELRTLGVDGGYSEADVVNTAHLLTGWGHGVTSVVVWNGTGPAARITASGR